ncbi:MAG: hypothetical protein AB1327_11335 [Bacillota bacterium]
MQEYISLVDWLTMNPGPYYVQVLTAREDGSTDETAGVILCEAERAARDYGLIRFEGEHGFAAFVEQALSLGIEPEPGKWAGRYANLSVDVPGFMKEAAVLVMRKEE